MPPPLGSRNTYSHKINGETYLVKYTTLLPPGVDGDCSDPREPNKLIRIDSRLRGEKHLSVLLHEFSHASNWFRCEEEVEQFSQDTAAFVYRQEILDRLGL